MAEDKFNKLPLSNHYSDNEKAHILHEGDAKEFLKNKELKKKIRLIIYILKIMKTCLVLIKMKRLEIGYWKYILLIKRKKLEDFLSNY